MMRLFLVLVLGVLLPMQFAYGISPYSLRVKIYGAWISKSPYCTQAHRLFYSEEANFLDFLGNPELGSFDNTDGSVDGTYHCLILQMSENIRFIPDMLTGNCSPSQTYTSRICGATHTTVNPETGESVSCTGGAAEDTVFLYLSTASTQTDISALYNPFQAPTSSTLTNGLTLSEAWQIEGANTGRFVINAFDQIQSSGGTCVLSTPVFGFSQQAN